MDILPLKVIGQCKRDKTLAHTALTVANGIYEGIVVSILTLYKFSTSGMISNENAFRIAMVRASFATRCTAYFKVLALISTPSSASCCTISSCVYSSSGHE